MNLAQSMTKSDTSVVEGDGWILAGNDGDGGNLAVFGTGMSGLGLNTVRLVPNGANPGFFRSVSRTFYWVQIRDLFRSDFSTFWLKSEQKKSLI